MGLGILGDKPRFDYRLNIVRPTYPSPEFFVPQFIEGMQKGLVTNNGPHAIQFEKSLAQYCNANVAICNSGQNALMVMLRAAGICGGEVIVPSFTFSATPHAVHWCGAKPIFADIGQDMVLDVADVERRINPNTVAILGVDVYGIACDYFALSDLGKRHNLKVLFDSAPSFGTKVNGQPVGGFGDAQIFSFHATKAFNTMEGGAIVSKNIEIIDRAKVLRNFGQIRGANCDEPGMNAKMMEVSALVGLAQLQRFDQDIEIRRASVQIMIDELSGVPGIEMAHIPSNQEPVWLYFPIVIDPQKFGLSRDELAVALEFDNIFVRKYFEMPCHQMATYIDDTHYQLPITEAISYNVLALPVYNNMTELEARGICQSIKEIFIEREKVLKNLRYGN